MARRARILSISVILILIALSLIVTLNDIYDKDIFFASKLAGIIRTRLVQPPFQLEGDEIKHDVILSAYMNSGSRFTGRFLGFRTDSFYFYEPLWKFSIWDYYKPPNVACSSIQKSCRTVTSRELNNIKPFPEAVVTEQIFKNIAGDTAPVDLLLHVLSSFYRCDLVHIHSVILDRLHSSFIYAGPSWQTYRDCISNFLAKSFCLAELEDICKKKRHRVVKILRLTLGSLRPLLDTNPRLKIIHLFRDPRAIIHSRFYSRHFPSSLQVGNDSLEISLCEKMLQDVQDGIELMKDFPEKVKFVYYEDLLSSVPAKMKQIYDFLSIPFNKSEIDAIADVSVNIHPSEMGNDFIMDRKSKNGVWWRRYMKWENIQRVQNVCNRTMSLLGYKVMEEKDIRNLSHSTIEIPYEFRI